MHTRNLFVRDDGSTLGVRDIDYRCIGKAYGFNEEPIYDADGNLLNDLTPTDEAKANAKLWAAADDMVAALKVARSALQQCAHVPGVTEQAIWSINEALSNAGAL